MAGRLLRRWVGASGFARPPVADFAFVLVALLAPIGGHWVLLNRDGDLARHLRMGEHILANGIYVRDVFSHTRAGDPFLSHEWLSQVVFALIHRVGGLAFVTMFAGLVLAVVYAALARFLIRRRVPALWCAAVVLAALVLGAAHWAARPHLFTLLMLVLLLPALDGRPRLWLVALAFALWANLHPGYVIGFALLGAVAAGELGESWLDSARRKHWLRRARAHAAALIVAILASLANPYGVRLLLDIRVHLADRYLMSVTSEFQPPDFHSTLGLLFLGLLVVLALALALARRRPRLGSLLPVLLLLAAALTARRNIAVFAIAGLPLAAVMLRRAGSRLPSLVDVVVPGDRGRHGRASRRRADPRFLLAPIVAVLLLGAGWNHGRVAGRALVPDSFDAARFPVEAVARARAAGLDGRLFNEFTWGGYVLYAWPEQRIFIDGMTAFFGADLMREYLAIVGLEPGWDAQLARRGIELALLPTGSPLALELARRGWHTWHSDRVATIMSAEERPAGGT